MKVLVIITTSFVPYGGLTTVAMNYYRHIDKKKIHMDFASTNEIPDVLKTELNMYKSCYYQLPKRSHLPLYYRTLKKICKKYDAVHIHANSATATIELQAAKKAGVSIRIVHNHNSKCVHKYIHSVLLPFYKKLYTVPIACSKKAGEWIFGKDKFIILNNSIDTVKYKYNEENRKSIREEFDIPSDAFVVGHVGKIYEPKNHIRIVSIFKKVLKKKRNAYLVLVGDGVLREKVKQYVKELGLDNRVIFAGMRSDTEKFLSAFDCFLFPSLWEGMPLAILEAQSAGLNCVMSSSIDEDAVICDTVTVLNLNQDDDVWCEAVLHESVFSREKLSIVNIQCLENKNYDVSLNAFALMNIYEQEG